MKTWIKNLRVRKKILLIISINVFFTALMTLISHQSLNKVDEIKADIVQVGQAASKQMNADMMHDALRADVYNAFLTEKTDGKGKENVKKDFAEHVGIFKTSLNELKNLKVNKTIINQANELRKPLNAYINSSDDLINKGLYTKFELHSNYGQQAIHKYKATFDKLAVQMEALSTMIEKEYINQQNILTDYSHSVQLTLFILGLIVAIIAITLSLFVSKLIEKPILLTEEVLGKISTGQITEPIEVEGKDETANMLRSLNNVVDNLTNVKHYVTEVGKGNFETDVEIFQNNGEIYESLHSMTDAIKANVEEDKKRNWTSEGLAKFVDITRDIQDVDMFYNNILSSLIRYINANQGYLYVINNDNQDDIFMEVKAVYAYGKQRYLEDKKEIRYKQGLVGQAWFDREPLYFTEIPADFVNITSGIGEATPRCVFIVPLMVNEKVLGVIEIASFEPLEVFKQEFVKKLSETIASTVDSAKTNERTRVLLELSQEAEQAMKAQEEEIRQNMEEMQATQAEMERVQRSMAIEKQRIEDEFEAQLNIINNVAIVSKTDVQGNITYVNDNFLKWAKYTKEEVMGKNHRILKSGDQDDAIFDEMWKTISSGKIFRGEIKNKAKDGSFYWVDAIVAPVLDKQGKPKEYIAQRFVINDQIEAREEMQNVLEETRAQEEEIRQNMEEMTAIQEQMERVQIEMQAQNNIINSVAIVSKTDVQGNITYVNEEFLKWSKYSLEEVMGQNHRMLKSGDQDDQIFVDMWKTISSGKIFRGEIKNKAKDGSFYWVDAIVAPILDESGKPKEYLAQRFVINDQIEARIEMQEMLEETRAQEEEIRQNMEEMSATQTQMERQNAIIAQNAAQQKGILDGIDASMATIEFKPDGTIVTANENFLNTTKCILEDIKGKHHRMFVPKDVQLTDDYKTLWTDLADGEEKQGIFKRIDSDGKTLWLNAIYNPIKNAEGKVIKVIKFATDVTTQKENEAELAAKMAGINATMATIEFTPEGNVLDANDNFLKAMNCTLKDIYGKHHRNFVPKEIKESEDYATFWTRLAAGIENKGVFKRINTEGKTVWLDAIYNPILNAEGKVIKVIKFATDITAKVELEAENKAQLDIINEIAIVSKTDLQGNITYVNEEFLTWSKYTMPEVMGKNHRMLKSGEQDDQIFIDMWKTISSGEIFRGEIKNKAKDGSFYWVDAIVAPILDENGKPKEYIAQRFVINDQKMKEQEMQEMLEETRAQEEEIRQSMEEMTAIQEQMERVQIEMQAQNNIINSIAIVSKTDVQGNITYVNEEFLKWSKYSEDEVMGKNHRMLKSGDQDDQIFVDMWKTISSGKIFRGEIKNKAKDGSIYWVDAIIAPVLDHAGKPKEYIAQRFVINEQKEREAKLNELLNKK